MLQNPDLCLCNHCDGIDEQDARIVYARKLSHKLRDLVFDLAYPAVPEFTEYDERDNYDQDCKEDPIIQRGDVADINASARATTHDSADARAAQIRVRRSQDRVQVQDGERNTHQQRVRRFVAHQPEWMEEQSLEPEQPHAKIHPLYEFCLIFVQRFDTDVAERIRLLFDLIHGV